MSDPQQSLPVGRRINTGRSTRLSRRAILAGVGASLAAPAVRAQARELVIPISSTSFATSSVRATEMLGCFAKNGLAVRLPVMDSGAALTTALVSGSVNVALGGSSEQISAVVRGQPIVSLTKVYWGMAGTLVLAKDVAEKTGVPPSAPAAARIKALDGLLVATPSPTSNYTTGYKGAAEAAGARIRLTYLAQPAMIAALESGAIQGYVSGAPFWGAQVAKGRTVVWLSGPRGDLPEANTPSSITAFQAMRPFAAANPDLMKRILESYRAFSDILERTPAEIRAVLGRLHPDIEPAAMDVLFEAEKDAWRMRPTTIESMKQEIAFVKNSGVSYPGLDTLDPASLIYQPPT